MKQVLPGFAAFRLRRWVPVKECGTIDPDSHRSHMSLPTLFPDLYQPEAFTHGESDNFYKQFFFVHEQTAISDRSNKTQTKEYLNDYVRRFRNTAMDCYEQISEPHLVEMCISGMEPAYRALLDGKSSSSALFSTGGLLN